MNPKRESIDSRESDGRSQCQLSIVDNAGEPRSIASDGHEDGPRDGNEGWRRVMVKPPKKGRAKLRLVASRSSRTTQPRSFVDVVCERIDAETFDDDSLADRCHSLLVMIADRCDQLRGLGYESDLLARHRRADNALRGEITMAAWRARHSATMARIDKIPIGELVDRLEAALPVPPETLPERRARFLRYLDGWAWQMRAMMPEQASVELQTEFVTKDASKFADLFARIWSTEGAPDLARRLLASVPEIAIALATLGWKRGRGRPRKGSVKRPDVIEVLCKKVGLASSRETLRSASARARKRAVDKKK